MSERAASPTARSSSVYQAFSDGPHAVRSRGASAGEDQGMASETRHDFAAPLASPSSSMPAGGSASRAPGHAEAESGSIINTVWSFIPAPLLRSFYRVRNTLAIYNFFTIYCLNAMLNIEIYREYMEEHGSTTGAAKDFTHRSLAQQLYIVSLAAPLGDVLVRVLARNFLKLNLVRAQASISFPASLSITTPSLNAYALLLMKGMRGTVLLVLTLDILEVVYTLYMFFIRSGGLSNFNPGAVGTKMIMLGWSVTMFCVDVGFLLHWRRFFKPLPRHMNPIYICWDAAHSFHWSSPNSIFDLMEEHEHLDSSKFHSRESRRIRKMIATFNQDQEELVAFAMTEGQEQDDEETGGGGGGGGKAGVGEKQHPKNGYQASSTAAAAANDTSAAAAHPSRHGGSFSHASDEESGASSREDEAGGGERQRLLASKR